MTADLASRVLDRIDTSDSAGCWLWPGARSSQGYGRIYSTGRLYHVHRVIYQATYGDIADGLVVDHTCHNADLTCSGGYDCVHRRCANPAHLEAVTHQVNILRGRAPGANAARMRNGDTCRKGHPLTEWNVRVSAEGHRDCRTCDRQAFRRVVTGTKPEGPRVPVVEVLPGSRLLLACGHTKKLARVRLDRLPAASSCLACETAVAA